MKNTNDLIQILINKQLLLETDAQNITVNKLTFDSRQVEPGTLFFCKGAHFRKEYLLDAKTKGAVAFISEIDYRVDLPRIIVNDIRLAMAYLGGFFYDFPDKKLKLIGITGSKGKSTTVAYIKGILDFFLLNPSQLIKKPCGIISTIETYDGIINTESTITTPEALDLWQHLANAVNSGLEFMVIEVSSQALKYNRVTGIDFDIVGLLNLGRDHISPLEHPNYQDYVNSKLQIFDLADVAVYSKDMENITKVEQRIEKKGLKSISYSVKQKSSDYFADQIELKTDSNQFRVAGVKFSIPGIGSYNIENALCAIAVTDYLGISKSQSAVALQRIETLGRDNLFKTNDGKIIIHVSYAHTSLSFEKSFETIQQHFPEYKLVTLFGASGSKGLNRIKDLPVSAAKYADFVYLIPDDPGFRKHQDIGKEMSEYLIAANCPYKILDEREAGLREAFSEAEGYAGKTLLFIAGKGSEHYQMIGNKPIPINSDLDVASILVTDYNQKLKNL